VISPPEKLATTVFARLPDRLRVTGRASRWAEKHRRQVTGSFLEGPSFDRRGNLYVVDVAFGRILRISPDGTDIDVIADYDGEPNGLKIHQDGRIFIADFRRGIMLLDPESGSMTPLLAGDGRGSFKGVNDLFFDSNGDLYFSDQGLTGWQDPTGRLFRYTAAGRLDCLIDTVPSPNGLVFDRDTDTVFLNVTRANAVWRVPLEADGGGVMKAGTFIQLSGGGGPDGLAMDEAGNFAVAHLGLGCVWIFSPLGEPLYRIVSCAGLATTNIAYGGPGNRTLYITESESGSILACPLETPGRVMYSHM